MIVIELMGGLGNWMFQIAFAEYLKQHFGKEVRLYIASKSPHSSNDLVNSIFENWKESLTQNNNIQHFFENNLHPHNWEELICNNSALSFSGYFQNYNYVTTSFINKLNIPSKIGKKYPEINSSVFLHIRGGDYVNHWFHDVGLDTNYYPNAIKEFPEGTKFSVFTNDIEYAKSKAFLKDISYEFIQESEIDSLYLMSQCKGGICANSTFSWWGAYLNPNRKLIIPSKWFNDTITYTRGYMFPEATVINV